MEHLYEYAEYDDLLKDLADLGTVEENIGFLVIETLRFNNKTVLRNYVILAKTHIEAVGLFLGPGGLDMIPDSSEINPTFTMEKAFEWVRATSKNVGHKTYNPRFFGDLVPVQTKLFTESSIHIIECDPWKDWAREMSKHFEMTILGGFKKKK